MDFVSTSQELIFSADIRTVCTTISIVNDQTPELNETFQVQLTSTNISRAVLGQSSTTITITDTDSMFQCLWIVTCSVH